VGRYIVELYLPSEASDGLGSVAARARSAAEALAGSGTDIRYLRSVFVPTDEFCFVLYEGSSAEAVAEAARRAAISFERIVAAVEDQEAGS
jgi:hypothetical protein